MHDTALTNWQWQDENTNAMQQDMKTCKFIKITQGDTVWPMPNNGPRPTPRPNGGEWRYGQNITTARFGWYPDMFVMPPHAHFLQEITRNNIQAPPQETQIGETYQESETEHHNAPTHQEQQSNNSAERNVATDALQEQATAAPLAHTSEPNESNAIPTANDITEQPDTDMPMDNSDTTTEDEEFLFDQPLSANPQEDSADDTP